MPSPVDPVERWLQKIYLRLGFLMVGVYILIGIVLGWVVLR